MKLLSSLVSLVVTSSVAFAQGGVTTFCPTGANGARISATGSALLDVNGGSGDLVLHASNVPSGAPGLFLMSTALTGPIPFGQGFRCISAPLVRLPVVNDATFAVDYQAPGLAGLFTPGSVWNYQFWFRSGSSFDLSDGISITFGAPELVTDVVTLSQGEFSGHPLAWGGGILLVQDATEWDALWQQHTGGFVPTPSVDFSQHAVVAVFLSTVSHGGVSIAVRSASLSVTRLDVKTQVTTPGVNCFVTAVMSQPHHIVRVPRVPNLQLGTWTSGVLAIDCP